MATASKQTAANDPQQPDSKPSPHGGGEVEKGINEAAAQGYFGERPDPTPLHHYTLDGVLAGKPTPETDPELAVKARAAVGVGSDR